MVKNAQKGVQIGQKSTKRRATGNFKLEGVVKMSGKEFWVPKNKSAEKPQKYSRRANLKGGGGHKAQWGVLAPEIFFFKSAKNLFGP